MRTFAQRSALLACFVCLGAAIAPARAQAQTSSVAPTLIPVSGQFLTPGGDPRVGAINLVISLYEGQNDSAPQWVETQAVVLDAQGRYSVQFGATFQDGLPTYLFTGPAGMRWLGVGIENEAEQPRMPLVSVPYAAKAASADTVGGKTLNDLVLTSTFKDDVKAVLQEEGVRTSSGGIGAASTANRLAKFTDGVGTTADSMIVENAGKIGIGTATPATTLDVSSALNQTEVRVSNTTRDNGGLGVYGPTGFLGGFYAASATNVGFYGANNVVSMVLDNNRNVDIPNGKLTVSGNIGVGTVTPLTKLHVAGTGAQTEVRVENTTLNNGGLGVYGPAGFLGGFYAASSTNIGFYGANNVVSMVLDNNRNVDIPNGRLTVAGNLGIGTTNPTTKLHVVGAATITGDLVVSGNIGAKYQDVAEWVDAAEPLEAGTVVIIDETAHNRVTSSRKSYDTRVAGAVSPQPGLILGEGGEGRVLVAQSGRVRIKVDASHGAITPGDILVTAPRAGYAMKSKSPKPGTVLGKALEPLASGTGEILVLLTLQ